MDAGRAAALEEFFRRFHCYMKERRRGMEVTGDWPMLCAMYDETKSLATDSPIAAEIVISVTNGKAGLMAEHHLTIGGVPVPCELTLLDER